MCLWLLPAAILVAADPSPADLAKLPPAAMRTVDYAKDIQPLLAQHCYECHGGDAQEAGFRLDRKKSALAGADIGPVVLAARSTRATGETLRETGP